MTVGQRHTTGAARKDKAAVKKSVDEMLDVVQVDRFRPA